MVTVVQVIQKGMKRNLVEVLDGVKFVVVILHVFKNTIYIYVDSVLERLPIPWDLKN
jgi:hypothetical protein